MDNSEKKRLRYSLLLSFFFVLAIWLVQIMSVVLDRDLGYLGIYPRTWGGLLGIFTTPFVHSGFNHLIDNSIPLLFLSAALLYFFRGAAYRIYFWGWLAGGLLVWLLARPAYHIGASGLVYFLASFLFFSGVIRNSINMIAFSLLIVFLYGSMIWGVFPIDVHISWESHLCNSVIGIALAFVYRKQGPQAPPSPFEDESDEPDTFPQDVDEPIVNNSEA